MGGEAIPTFERPTQDPFDYYLSSNFAVAAIPPGGLRYPFSIHAVNDDIGVIDEGSEDIVITLLLPDGIQSLVEQGLLRLGTLTRTLYILDAGRKPALSLGLVQDVQDDQGFAFQ